MRSHCMTTKVVSGFPGVSLDDSDRILLEQIIGGLQGCGCSTPLGFGGLWEAPGRLQMVICGGCHRVLWEAPGGRSEASP